MATVGAPWLLCALPLLLNLPRSLSLGAPPAIPSTPECYIPCDESNYFSNIHCSWEPRQTSQIPTNYSLMWRPTHKSEEQEIPATAFNGVIPREHFSDPAELIVWVQAKNQYGSAKSNEHIFNTTDIIKPPPPKFNELDDGEAFEIHWNSVCDQLMKFVGLCDVRYRTDADQTWIVKKGFYSSYTVEDPENCTAYELQVRCACKRSLASNWSASHQIPALEMAPRGKLDMWMDCGMLAKASDCILNWKACGFILGYEIRLFYDDKELKVVNLSTSPPTEQLKCDKNQCRFLSLIKDANLVSLSAYNAHGATKPWNLPKFVTGETRQTLRHNMTEENLTVSWDMPAQISDSLKEYVVQYKQVGSPLGQKFDWVKLNKSQTAAFFRGHFQHYTAYRVSLFAVLHGNEVRHLSSVIGYSLQKGIVSPSRVPSFELMSIAATDVRLSWEPFPLSKQEGLVLNYQIGVDQKGNVYNVSVVPPKESKTETVLQHLSPGQEYEAWIRAVTAAGPGEKTTLGFKTNHSDQFESWILDFAYICFSVPIVWFTRKTKVSRLLSRCIGEIPDPQNSQIFREMKHQIHEPMTWICSPPKEPLPQSIILEVMFIQPSLQNNSDADELSTPMRSSPIEFPEDQREDAVRGDHRRTQAYSKMVDSDEERSWSSTDEEPYTSGYEKHFMPTVAEVSVIS